jgi:uncharacterized membrane protein
MDLAAVKVLPTKRRHAPFYWGIGAAIATAASSALWLPTHLAIGLSANAFFLVYLVLMGIRIPHHTANYLRANASAEDEPVSVLFIVVVIAVAGAFVGLFMLINLEESPSTLDLGLALCSVLLGWLTIHTLSSNHYAHLYWRPIGESGERKTSAGGLTFPGDSAPNGYDFLYFAFGIGMTAEASDTEVTSTQMRKAVLVHALISFLFNAVLVAAILNVVVSLSMSD